MRNDDRFFWFTAVLSVVFLIILYYAIWTYGHNRCMLNLKDARTHSDSLQVKLHCTYRR